MLPKCNFNINYSLYLVFSVNLLLRVMKKIILFCAFFIPCLVHSQDANSTNNTENSTVLISYSGEDDGNYRFVKYHGNGATESIGQFKNGQKHGVWKTWNSNGKLEAVAHYRNGEKTGKWIIVDDTDHMVFELSFNHNQLLHALKKNDHGQIIAKR